MNKQLINREPIKASDPEASRSRCKRCGSKSQSFEKMEFNGTIPKGRIFNPITNLKV